ncbi:protein RESPONSE TO ABA AND SALT 1-like [Pyrus x bretschneideri]|uniref:protein RESPONSE TO ABA AND SALT 1-like n=1 Tax=Pyrus x bretschneideri TaxID=225117 RepID=UPI0020306A17|nr:protein RESPONSE TO ABA AND SALT 1-like [Pyrus x bretschneideri]
MKLAVEVSSLISITCPQSKSKTKIPKEIPHLSNPTSYLIPPISLFFVAIKTPESFTVFVLVMTNGSQSGNASNTFEAFYEGWLVRQGHFLDELLLRLLQIRYTSYERSLLWIAGYKQSIVFQLVTESVSDLSDQLQVRMARLREATRVEERALNDKRAKIHESVAAPPFMDAVRQYRRAGHGEIVEDDVVIKSLKSALESVVENANLLRMMMATKLVDLLSSGQAVKFWLIILIMDGNGNFEMCIMLYLI